MDNRGWWRALAFVLLIGAVALIGFGAYQAGIAQGMMETGKVVVPAAGAAPYADGTLHYWRPFGFGFGFLGCLFPLFFFFLFFALLRGFFWRGPWGHRHWSQGVPPSFEEWHQRAHGRSSPDAPMADKP